MEELRALFGDYLHASRACALNWDDPEVRALGDGIGNLTTFGVAASEADLSIEPRSISAEPTAISATVIDRRDQSAHPFRLAMPGRHNLSNALGAIAAASAAGVSVDEAVKALGTFAGLARRFEIIGTTAAGITVIDDFGHNPEKCAATLRTLKQHPGRVIAFFQPHGYGPLRQMGHELAETFARELGPDDVSVLCDPVYFGGTADRSEGATRVVRLIEEAGGHAEYVPTRDAVADRIVELARPGDRIVVMGARDDTLTEFARELFGRLG
jgi:UDP-N-acetylmuramate--alanine ligase